VPNEPSEKIRWGLFVKVKRGSSSQAPHFGVWLKDLEGQLIKEIDCGSAWGNVGDDVTNTAEAHAFRDNIIKAVKAKKISIGGFLEVEALYTALNIDSAVHGEVECPNCRERFRVDGGKAADAEFTDQTEEDDDLPF